MLSVVVPRGLASQISLTRIYREPYAFRNSSARSAGIAKASINNQLLRLATYRVASQLCGSLHMHQLISGITRQMQLAIATQHPYKTYEIHLCAYKKKGGCNCPICLEIIIESTKSKSGHDAIFCEGHCNSWLHRRSAGLSKPLFAGLEKSTDPFYCPHCQLQNLTSEISTLKETIKSLNESITTLQSTARPSDQLPDSKPTPNVSPDAPTADVSQPERSLINKPPVPPPTTADKKFNIVIYVIKESPPKTTKVNQPSRTRPIKYNSCLCQR